MRRGKAADEDGIIADMLKDGLGRELKFAGRPASAAPAAGYMSVHTEQQRQLVEDAFNL